MKKMILMGVLSLLPLSSLAQNPTFEQPPLPYSSTSALEPTISSETVDLHWNKHLAGYFNKLNSLANGTDYEAMTLEEICLAAPHGAIYNNAAQAWNHLLYFNTLNPKGSKRPTGELKQSINRDFGSLENFKAIFEKAGAAQFGSGWVWLTVNNNGKLEVLSTPNARNPLGSERIPLLGIDVWEHAYYLDYQNRRSEHLSKIWDIVDFSTIEDRYREAKKGGFKARVL